ncbi:MAG: hypothetical protein JWN40_4186 [Phycisphaerales bacterium]|nr:hypothetical protein [Phycisphaerales bacterium]
MDCPTSCAGWWGLGRENLKHEDVKHEERKSVSSSVFMFHVSRFTL